MHWARTFGIALLAGSLASVAAAEMPAGAYEIGVGGAAGLAFPSGTAELCEPTPDGEVCVSSDLATDAEGVVSGVGLVSIGEGAVAEVALQLSGRISGSTQKPKTLLDFTAEGHIQGVEIEGSGKLRCRTHRELPSNQQVCQGRGRMCAIGGRCRGLPFLTVLQFDRMPFTIALDVETDERNRVLGEASVLLDHESATPIAYAAKGKYKTSADSSSLKLTGADPAAKTSVALKKLALEAGEASAGAVAFKILGQKGKADLPTSPLPAAVVDTSALNGLLGGFEVPHMPPSNGFIFYFY